VYSNIDSWVFGSYGIGLRVYCVFNNDFVPKKKKKIDQDFSNMRKEYENLLSKLID